MKLSELIKKRRAELGLTWTDFEDAGIHCNTLSNLLNDKQGGIKPATQEKLALVLKVSQGEIQACVAEMNPLKKVVNKKSLAKQKPKKAKPEPEPEELPFDDLPEQEPDAVAKAVMAETEAYDEPKPIKWYEDKPKEEPAEKPKEKVPVKKEAIMKEPEGMDNYLKKAADDIEKALDKVGDAAAEAMASITKGISLGILPADDTLDDPVNHPSHYTQGTVECIDAIESSMTPEEFRGYLKGCQMKYIWRYQHKGGVEDLKKARWYLDRLIKFWGGKV